MPLLFTLAPTRTRPMSHPNPYQPPQAPVLDYLPPPTAGRFLGQPRKVAGARGASWYGDAWRLLIAHAGLWLVNLALFAVLMLTAWLPPWVGLPLQYMLFPFTLAALALACDAVRRGAPLRVDEIIGGLAERGAQLSLLGLLYLVGIIVVSVVAIVPLLGWGGLGVLYGELPQDPQKLQEMLMPLMLAMLILIALSLPLLMALWLAPALVVLNGVNAVSAMGASLVAFLRNFWPFFLYGLAGLGLFIVATLPLLLGWLLLMPVIMVTSYSAYRDIFFEGNL